MTKRKIKQRLCGSCGKLGHNSRTCSFIDGSSLTLTDFTPTNTDVNNFDQSNCEQYCSLVTSKNCTPTSNDALFVNNVDPPICEHDNAMNGPSTPLPQIISNSHVMVNNIVTALNNAPSVISIPNGTPLLLTSGMPPVISANINSAEQQRCGNTNSSVTATAPCVEIKREVSQQSRPPPLPRPVISTPVPPVTVTPKPQDGGDPNERFGWARIDTSNIPVIYRPSADKSDYVEFVVVKMVELKLLWRYPNNYPDPLQKRPALRSTFMYSSEAVLINEINETHCTLEYGTYKFEHKDLLVKRKEFEDFYTAVKDCFPEITNNQAVKVSEEEIRQMSGGWVQINNTVCPYVKRKDSKFVPLSVIQYSAHLLKDNYIEGWLPSPKECAYFNDCCSRVGLRFSFGRDCLLVCIDLVKRLCSPEKCEDLPRDRPFDHVKPIPQISLPVIRGVTTIALPERGADITNINPTVSVTVCVNGEILDQANPQFSPGGVLINSGNSNVGPRFHSSVSSTLNGGIGLKRPSTSMAQQTTARAPLPAATLTAAAAASLPRSNNSSNSRQAPQPSKRANIQQTNGRPNNQITSSGGPSIVGRVELRVTQAGSCFKVRVKGVSHPNHEMELGAIQPAPAIMVGCSQNYTPALYVVLEHAKNLLFPNWERLTFFEKIKSVVAEREFLNAPSSIMRQFSEVFNLKLSNSEQTILAMDTFLKVLPYLQIKYSQTLANSVPSITSNTINARMQRPITTSISATAPVIHGVSSLATANGIRSGQTATNPVVID